MKALKYYNNWDVGIANVDDLIPKDDEVIVNISVCGICGTDVGIISGDYSVALNGITLGHEAAGTVYKIGKGITKFKAGDRVFINPTYFCGECRMCSTGNQNHCEMKNGTESGVSYDGAFANQYRAKENFLHKLDDSVSFDSATLVEPLSCAITGVDKLNIKNKNIRASVIGAGPMGLVYLWALKEVGVNAFLVENNQYRYKYASKVLPSGFSIYNDFQQALESEYKENKQIDLVIDTTGQLTETILSNLSPGGKILTIALKNKIAKIDVLKIADKSLSIIGSIDSLNDSFERAYKMIRDKRIPADKLISHKLNLDDYKEAFKLIGCDIAEKRMIPINQESCKVLLKLV